MIRRSSRGVCEGNWASVVTFRVLTTSLLRSDAWLRMVKVDDGSWAWCQRDKTSGGFFFEAYGRAVSSKGRGRHQLTNKREKNQMLISNADRRRVLLVRRQTAMVGSNGMRRRQAGGVRPTTQTKLPQEMSGCLAVAAGAGAGAGAGARLRAVAAVEGCASAGWSATRAIDIDGPARLGCARFLA